MNEFRYNKGEWNMKIVHAFNKVTGELVRVYFVDEKGNEITDYTVEEHKKSIK